MGTYILDQTTSAGNRGSCYNAGSEFLYYVNENGAIYRQPVNPATLLTRVTNRTLGTTSHNLNGTGAPDLRLFGGQVQGLNGAQIALLSTATGLNTITPQQLMSAGPWSTSLPESGTSTTGVYYAVKIPYLTTDHHYAAVRIYKEGTIVKADWVSYITSTKPLLLHQLNTTEYPSPRAIVVSEHDAFLFVSGGAQDAGYVLKIPRLVTGAFPQYSSNPFQLNILPLKHPQQMVVEGDLVFVADDDGLFVINAADGFPVRIVSGITNPIGLLIDEQGGTRVAHMTTTAGEMYSVDITDFSPPVFDNTGSVVGTSPDVIVVSEATATVGGSSGHLTWADTAHTAFFATLPASNEIVRFDLNTNTASPVQTDTPVGASPQSVVVFDEYDLSVICNAQIGDIYCGMAVTGVLLMGIGLIPFDYITNSIANPAIPGPNDGKADTSSTPGYYFSAYPHLPFAGSLSILINHAAAWSSGARYYKARWTNKNGVIRQITASFVDYRWNPIGPPPRYEGVTTYTQNDYYPVRNPSELWYNPHFGFVVSTTEEDNGHNRLEVDFFDANYQPLANASFDRLVYVDASRANGRLFHLRIGDATTAPEPDVYQVPSACGVVQYQSKNDRIAIDTMAWRADGLGTYTLSCYRGGALKYTKTGNASVNPTLNTVTEFAPGRPFRIGHLVGDCDIANVGIALTVPTRAINGFGWANLGYYAAKSFALAVAPVSDTPWTEPP